MQQTTHDNHFVPQLYLKQWSDNGINIWSYRILVSHQNAPEWEYRPIRGVAFQKDLYTEFENDEEIDDFEKWLEEEFENPVMESINKILNDRKLSSLDWERLVRFLGAQDVRTPQNFLESMERWDRTFPKLMQDTIEKSVNKFEQLKIGDKLEEESHSDTEYIELFKKTLNIKVQPSSESENGQGYIEAEVLAGRALWIESQKLWLTNTIKALLGHNWSIIRPVKGFQWFTSDHPVVKLNYYGNGKYDLHGGWGSKGTNIFMPISPQHMLFTQIGYELDDKPKLNIQETRQIQRFIAERAFRWIFADRQINLVRKLRPRQIDPQAFSDEKMLWKKWNEQQIQAEKEFSNDIPLPYLQNRKK